MNFRTGLLISSNSSWVRQILSRIQSDINHTLYIQFIPHDKLKYFLFLSETESIQDVNKLLYRNFVMDCYKNTISLNHLDIRLLLTNIVRMYHKKISTHKPIDIVYFDQNLSAEQMRVFSSFIANRSSVCQYISLPLPNSPQFDTEISSNDVDFEQSCNVVLGGTFDKLHIGHKILLSEAILRSKKTLTVGVTDNSMLHSKKLFELIDSCEDRISKINEFLQDVEQNLKYNVVPIYDIYGPTKDEPSFETIIVSAETVGGATKINKIRKEKGLNELKVVVVPLLSGNVENEETDEEKVSSSNSRIRLLGTLLVPPKPKLYLPFTPYVIGLTGGIASGKSFVSQCLSDLGAEIINADHLGHTVYEDDTYVYNHVKEYYGQSVLKDDGSVNRKVIASIVFKNKDELNKLNNLLWPRILARIKGVIDNLRQEGKHKVIVIEAAVLIPAKWDHDCHELWTCIVPPEEAVRRLKERNNLTEEEALNRISSQPSNTEYVSHANVVFSTLWSQDFTRMTVENAWSHLQKRI